MIEAPISTKNDNQAVNNILTGEQFLETMRDGREIWFEGEKIKDITAHPAFRNSALSVAQLYDAMHDDEQKDKLTRVDKLGITTHKFFTPSYSAQELAEAREAIAIWQRMSYGWMGRTPDYKAAFMAQLLESYDFYDPHGGNALEWYKRCAAQCLFINHVLIDPPMDRHRARVDVRDVYLSVDKDDDKGIYVSGAKMVATGSALTHATFVAVNSGTAARMEKGRDEDMALVFLIEMDAPGLKMITRPSYERNAISPFDAPLASRFDENDAVLVFDNAFIPWENVLIYRDVEKTKGFYSKSGFFNRFNLQSAVRLATKLEFCAGLLMKGTDASGTSQFRGVQAAIGELISMRELIWSLTTAMVYDPEPHMGGSVVPRIQTAAASRVYTTRSWNRVREIFETVLAGAPIYTISSVKDLKTAELQPLLDQYYRGTGLTGPERIKLFKLVWDALYSEFAGRHGLYERNYAGNQEQHYLDTLNWAKVKGDADRYRGMVDQCLADYDEDGWQVDYLRNGH